MDGDPRALSLRQWRGLDPVERAERVDECVAMAEESAHGDWVRVAVSPSTGDGPLAGIPFSVKDNIDAAGFTTTAGSPLVPEAPAEVDAGVVAVLRDAGGVVVGKTNMHELALGITGNNTAYGPVRNPADPARSAGGSSGGSAVGVALGVVPFGLGTDTGGSVTIPASFCGVVGFRPSTGRYPGDGLVAISSSRDTAGLHARTVADVRFLDELVTSVPGPAGGGVEGLRVGVPRSRYEDVDPEVDEVSRRALSRLAEAGAVLVEVDVPDDLAVGAGPGIELVLYEAPRLLVARLGRAFEEIVAGTASPDVRGLLELMLTSPIPAERYRAARAAGLRLRRGYAEVFGGVDVYKRQDRAGGGAVDRRGRRDRPGRPGGADVRDGHPQHRAGHGGRGADGVAARGHDGGRAAGGDVPGRAGLRRRAAAGRRRGRGVRARSGVTSTGQDYADRSTFSAWR